MTLWAHRHPRPERLVELLAHQLSSTWPADPFARVSIVVGSRGMERWLRGELATRHGSIAGVDFLFPGRAFAAATNAIFTAASPQPAPADVDDRWSGNALTLRVVRALRARLVEPAFARVARYLDHVDDSVGTRELAFAGEVAAVVERLHYDRPDTALAWAKVPDDVDGADGNGHRWLARLLADLADDGGATEPPAAQLARLRALPPTPGSLAAAGPLHVFGLSSLGRGDMLRIAALAPHVDIHLFALVPSSKWWADIRGRADVRRELRKARTPAERAALLSQLERSNPMLAANGAPSRDLQLWLEEVGYESIDLDDADAPPPRTRLQRLQRFIDDAGDAPDAQTPPDERWSDDADDTALGRAAIDHEDEDEDENDGADSAAAGPASPPLPSIELHACHGALRQCEALRDELLRRFAHDATLEPRHVLVMTPDLATYAPLVAAVFGRVEPGAPALPVHIADLGVRDTNGVAEVLLDVLALVDERVDATALLDLLGHEPVRAKFGVGDDDLGALRDLVVSSGLRWAWDEGDRARHDQPAVAENTVRFALERLALGLLMPDPGEHAVVPARDGFGPAVPVDLPTRDQAARFGVLAAFCDALQRRLSTMRTAATTGEWRQRLQATLDAFCAVPDDRAWQRQQVTATIAEFLPDDAPNAATTAAPTPPPLRLAPAAVSSLLADAFAVPRSGDRPATGAVTVCSMEPMRSVPFRVIAMIGMDDGAFPRASRPRAWDPFAVAEAYETERRVLDRHVFLESILCARDALLIFGRGFESARGLPVPMSVVVEELRELLTAAQPGPADLQAAAGADDKRCDVLRSHPLQPWSPQAFADVARRPFGSSGIAAARARLGPQAHAGLAATSPDAPWPSQSAAPRTVTARALARALANAPACLLEHALGVHVDGDEVEVKDREPIELDHLESWRVRDGLLGFVSAADGDVDVARVLDRHRASGELPLGAGGEAVLSDELVHVNALVARLRKIGDRVDSAVTLRCTAGGDDPVVVTAVVPELRGAAHVWPTASKTAGERLLLEAWISLLIAVAAHEPVPCAHVVADDTTSMQAPSPADALGFLDELVALWRRALRAPLPLVPVFSRAVAEAASKTPDASPESIVDACVKYWFGDDEDRSAMADTAAAALFGATTEQDLLDRAADHIALAGIVWGPLLVAAVPGAADAAETEDGDE